MLDRHPAFGDFVMVPRTGKERISTVVSVIVMWLWKRMVLESSVDISDLTHIGLKTSPTGFIWAFRSWTDWWSLWNYRTVNLLIIGHGLLWTWAGSTRFRRIFRQNIPGQGQKCLLWPWCLVFASFCGTVATSIIFAVCGVFCCDSVWPGAWISPTLESLRNCGRLSIFACCCYFSLLLSFFLFEGGHDWLNRWWVLWVSVFLLMLFWVCVV